MRLKGFDLTKGVIDLGEVERSLKDGSIPKAFYVIADFQNPSGALMPLSHRQKLLELADQYGFLIIEDGPYRHLRYAGDAVPTFQELDYRYVLHMSSFSKMISPGIRVGYMVGSAKVIPPIRQYAEDSCINSSHLNQAMVFEFIRNGWLEGHVESLITLYRSRLNTMLDSLQTFIGDKGEWLEPQGGFFAGLTLNENIIFPDAQTCQAAGLALSNSQGFFLNDGERFLRLPFCALTPEEIRTGIQRLAGLL